MRSFVLTTAPVMGYHPAPMSADENPCPACGGARSAVAETAGPAPACAICGGERAGATTALASHVPRLEGYVVEEEAGRGGIGVVFRAVRRSTGARVAIKVLGTFAAGSEAQVRRIEREAAVLARLPHPGVTRYHETLWHEGRPHLVMEWVEGESLDRRLRSRKLAAAEALRITLDLLEILGHAHRQGVVHRDVKPQNVLLTEAGQVKLTDFGLALLTGDEAAAGRITATGANMGTFGYMAPEQRRDASRVDARADLYSVGVVLYEMLTGELPMGRFPPPSEHSPDCPAAVDPAILRALEADPARRYGSAEEMAEALRAAAGVPAAATERELPAGGGDPEMVAIPGGRFTMGPPEQQHEVELPGFWLDRRPVDNAQYRRFVEATGHPEPRYWLVGGRADVPIGPEYPVVGVSWEDARAYANWCGKRLPTEAEWERAARGTDARRYPWGSEPEPERCNCRDSSRGGLEPAGARPQGAGPEGAEDLLGNTLEWTASLDVPYPYAPGGEREAEASPGKRILRGGSWFSQFRELSSWARYPELTGTCMHNVGFRCARDRDREM